MAPLCWGYMAKYADDTTKIVDEIALEIEEHNSHPDAHMGDGYALWTHRLQAYLDHPYESVRNVNIIKEARSYDYIVDANGKGDFLTPKEAIDQLIADGGGSVFIAAGTYTISADIDVTEPIEIYGEGQGLTILDFNADIHEIHAAGSSGTHLASFEIHNLTCSNHHGNANGPIVCEYVDNLRIDQIDFDTCDAASANSPYCIYLSYCEYYNITSCIFSSSTNGIYAEYCDYDWISNNKFDTITNWGIAFKLCSSCVIRDNNASDCLTFFKGLDSGVADDNSGLVFLSNVLALCTGDAFNIEYGGAFTFLGNIITTTQTTRAGIFFGQVGGVLISSNQITTYQGPTVYFGASTLMSVTNNQLNSNHGDIIGDDGTDRFWVQGNSIVAPDGNLFPDAAYEYTGIPDYGGITIMLHDNVASYDLDVGSSCNWTTWAVPHLASDAVAVILAVKVRGPNGTYLAFRTHGRTYPEEGSQAMVQGSDSTTDADYISNVTQCTIPVDDSGYIDYKCNRPNGNDRAKVFVLGYIRKFNQSDFNFWW